MAINTPPPPKTGKFADAIHNDEIECRAILACDQNGILACNGGLIFRSKKDMDFFKEKTMGQVVVMGRKTFESMGSIGLKGRICIVMSKTPGYYKTDWTAAGYDKEAKCPIYFVSGTTAILDIMQELGRTKLWIIGGAKIYSMFLAYTRTIMVTYYRVDLLKDGVRYGLLPPGFHKKDLTILPYIPWIRQHHLSILDQFKYDVVDSETGKPVKISASMNAYVLHQSKASHEAMKALNEEKKQMSAAGFLYKGGNYDRSKNPPSFH